MRQPRLPIYEDRLDNGLTLLVAPRPGTGVVTADVWVRTGSADEPPHLSGVSHFLEHMLFKGAGPYGAGDVDRLVEGIGGVMNAGTAHDYTTYFISSAADQFETILGVLSEVVRNATLDEEELDRERQVVLEEFYRMRDEPRGLLWEMIYEAAFESGPYKASVLGSPESLADIDSAKMREYYERHYAPENMSVVVVGDVTPERARSACAKVFRGFDRPFRPMLAGGPPPEKWAAGAAPSARKQVQEHYGMISYPVPPMGKDLERSVALDALQCILGGGHASALYQEIREKKRLANTIGVGYGGSRHTNLFTIAYTCEPGNRESLEQAVLEELEKFVKEPPPEPALSRARRVLAASHAFSLETTHGEASSIGFHYCLTGSLNFERDYFDLVEAVDAEAVHRAASDCLKPGERVGASVEPLAPGEEETDA